MGCITCGTENRATATFCGHCGEPIGRLLIATSSNGHKAEPRVEKRVQESDATRYLCAAVHLNSAVADAVIDGILEQEFRAVPSSPYVDLRPVVKHALAARSRQLTRDGLLFVLLAMMAGFLVMGQLPLLLVALVLCWVIVLGESLIARYGVLAHQLGPGNFNPDTSPRAVDDHVLDRLEEVEAYRKSTVTVYSSYRPFVGHGRPLDGWSVALDIRSEGKHRVVEPFTAADVDDFVLARMREFPVGAVDVTQRIYVDGRDIRNDRRFLDDPESAPKTRVDDDLRRQLLISPEDRARPYLCVQVSGWKGQLVLSMFLRFVVTPKELFVEVSYTLLTPVSKEFQVADELLPEPTPRQFLAMAVQAGTSLPMRLVSAPGAAIGFFTGATEASRRSSQQRRQIKSLLRFNYGAPVSPRELVMDANCQRYFQDLDEALYAKVLAKRLLHSIAEFFEARGIDTSELLDKAQAIENHGVWVENGTVIADNIAAGPKSKAGSRKKK